MATGTQDSDPSPAPVSTEGHEEGENVVCLLEGPENSTLYRQEKPQGGD